MIHYNLLNKMVMQHDFSLSSSPRSLWKSLVIPVIIYDILLQWLHTFIYQILLLTGSTSISQKGQNLFALMMLTLNLPLFIMVFLSPFYFLYSSLASWLDNSVFVLPLYDTQIYIDWSPSFNDTLFIIEIAYQSIHLKINHDKNKIVLAVSL